MGLPKDISASSNSDTCLMLERHLEKGSWPSLLQEITFYCNHLDNASSKIFPHMLPFGRQPISPINMLISTVNTPTKVTRSSSQYFETTVMKGQELSEIARENQECTQSGAKKKYDKGKKTSNITTGDWVMINMEDYSYIC